MTDDAKNLSSSLTIRKFSAKDLRSKFQIGKSPGSYDFISNFTVRNKSAKDLSSSLTIRKVGAPKDLSTKIAIRNKGSADLLCNFWVNAAKYSVERISNTITQMTYTPPSIATGSDYATVLEVDTKGYKTFSAVIAAGNPSDITYRIQGLVSQLPNVWAGITGQVDIDVTASDPDNMGTMAVFTGAIDRIRIQVKQKTTAGRAWASLKAST